MKSIIVYTLMAMALCLTGCIKEPTPCFSTTPANINALKLGQPMQLDAACSKDYTTLNWQIDTIANYSTSPSITVTFTTTGTHTVRLTVVNKNVKGHTIEKTFQVI